MAVSIVVHNANNIVLFDGEDFTGSSFIATVPFMSRELSDQLSDYRVITGVTLPAGYIPGCWQYSDGGALDGGSFVPDTTVITAVNDGGTFGVNNADTSDGGSFGVPAVNANDGGIFGVDNTTVISNASTNINDGGAFGVVSLNSYDGGEFGVDTTSNAGMWSVLPGKQSFVDALIARSKSVMIFTAANITPTNGLGSDGITHAYFDVSWSRVHTAEYYEIRYKTTEADALYSTVTVRDSGNDTTQTRIAGLVINTAYKISIRVMTHWGLSDWCLDVDKTSIDSAPLPVPIAVTNVLTAESLYSTNVVGEIKSRLLVSWDAVTPVVGYDVEVKTPGLTEWAPKGRVTRPTITLNDTQPGLYSIQVRAVSNFGIPGPFTLDQVTVLGKTAPPSNVTGLAAIITRGQLRLSWNPVNDLDVFGYEVQLGTVWDQAGNVKLAEDYTSTSLQWTPTSSGTLYFMIKAIDTTGNKSTDESVLTYVLTAPSPVSSLTQKVIDNIVELHWLPSAVPCSFPIDYYELYKGIDWTTALASGFIGRKYGTFDLLSESIGGNFKYWVRAVDIAGLASSEMGVYAVVSQPPDYVLQDQQNIDLTTATLVNAKLNGTSVIMLVNTAETFAQHFTNHAWTSPSNQVAAYPQFGQPGMATASIEKIIDYLPGATGDSSLGAELVVNGDFSVWSGGVPTGWIWSGTISQNGLACVLGDNDAAGAITQNILTVGKTYECTFSTIYDDGGGVYIQRGISWLLYIGTGIHTERWVADGTAFNVCSGNLYANIDNVSVKEVIAGESSTIASSKISMAVTRNTPADVTVTPWISTSPDNITWSNPLSVYEAFFTAFRYVKYRLDYAASAGGIDRIDQIAVKLDVKQRTTTCKMDVADISSDGTQVNFSTLGFAPVDILSIAAECPYNGNGALAWPLKALVNFVDSPNPSFFKVLAWDNNGNRVAINNVAVTIRYI
jgi:hypothetical protein